MVFEKDKIVMDNLKLWLVVNKYFGKIIKIMFILKVSFYVFLLGGCVMKGVIIVDYFVKGDVDSL